MPERNATVIGIAASLLLLLFPLQPWLPIELSWLETFAVISYAWSVWLLTQNNPLGWWMGLIGTALYGIVFFQAKLYAEVGLQLFYFVTSLQAIAIGLRGGQNQREKPVGHLSRSALLLSAGLAGSGLLALRMLLMALRGAAPVWDALTTIMSLVAHLFLMGRYIESWYLWIAVDIIYVPLYASRGLYLTSLLYVIFGLMAVGGLHNFQQIYQEQQLQVGKR
jgi:nicotinamide mononucleotide transporter